MRAELEILEQIDRYLGGHMSASEASAFKGQIASDPALQTMVDNQQLMIKTVNRQALMSEINMIAGAAGTSAWYTNVSTWIVTGLVTIGVITGIVLMNSETPEIMEEQLVNVNTPVENEIIIPVDEDTAQVEIEIEEEYPEPMLIYPFEPNVILSYENNIRNVVANVPIEEFEIIEFVEEVEIVDEVSDDSYNPGMNKNKQASFPGGAMPMKRYFEKNLKFPGTAREKEIEGIVRINFYVYSTGVLEEISSECETLKGKNGEPFSGFKMMMNTKVRNLFEKEASRLIRLMPTWEPATDKYGSPMTVPMELYIDFDINGFSTAYDLGFDSSEGAIKTEEDNSEANKGKSK